MNLSNITRNSLQQFSAFSHAFGNQQLFESFITAPFDSIERLNTQAEAKQSVYPSSHRKVLVSTLEKQIGGIVSERQQANLTLLKDENTFTITTGHQLTLFGGPLFLVYKALHAVCLCERFNESQPGRKAVPIFWIAAEDHDVDEIRFTHLFNQKLVWETQQTGPVGRMNLADFDSVFDQFKGFFAGKETAVQELLAISTTSDYASFQQEFLTKLFADFGVLVLQPDAEALKRLFVPVVKREILQKPSFFKVEEANARLKKDGWNPQAQARACNLFYLTEGARLRIDVTETGFAIDGELVTTEQLLEWVDEQPQSFSPNVVLRPVYQETILPNLAYIGGGGEMAYWVQLKGVFEAHETLYPLLQQRNSLHLIDSGTSKRIAKIGWEWQRFFEPKEQLRKEYIREHDEDQLDISSIQAQFEELRLSIIAKAKAVDISLESFAEAETVRMQKQLESFEARLIKQVKQQHEQVLKSIDFVCDRFLPENELQERYFHWLHFAPDGNYKQLLSDLYTAMDPFQPNLIVCEWPAS